MNHYLFEEFFSGEQFIVGADSLVEAYIEADEIVEDFKKFNELEEAKCVYICRLTDEEAEASGLDEY